MRIAVLSTQTPFVNGGAECLAQNLVSACKSMGHEVDIVSHPFSDKTPQTIRQGIELWQRENVYSWNNIPDLIICLKFPCYYINFPNKVIWLLHQYRSVYDIWDYLAQQGHQWNNKEQQLKVDIIKLDNESLKQDNPVYTISKNVSNRLLNYNQIISFPLLHPAGLAEKIKQNKSWISYQNYILAPSRLEPLKRQHLAIEALLYTKSRVKLILCGQGSEQKNMFQFIQQHKLHKKVKLLGHVSDNELIKYYKKSRAVFFAPYDEDYGYITLEAMQNKKAVITCTDSGGPLQFIQHQHNGYIEEPDPIALAKRFDQLMNSSSLAKKMGNHANKTYKQLQLSWQNVVVKLLENTNKVNPND
ncbi:MAG: glycosyltransferase family 4 protein [Gammaproteobacteria bacterium]|nr:glycosyltransferase family 4 protein [Gammaproteobacteria bacterium]